MPFGSGASWSCRFKGWPPTVRTGPVATSRPELSTTLINESAGSGSSVNVMTMRSGGASSAAPSGGSDWRSKACARAGGAAISAISTLRPAIARPFTSGGPPPPGRRERYDAGNQRNGGEHPGLRGRRLSRDRRGLRRVDARAQPFQPGRQVGGGWIFGGELDLRWGAGGVKGLLGRGERLLALVPFDGPPEMARL